MIRLNENYTVTSDSNNWMLNYEKTYTNEKGKEVTSRDTWYFPRLSDLLKNYLDLRLKDQGTANDILIAISKVERDIENSFKAVPLP
jgi:hypothetical protein